MIVRERGAVASMLLPGRYAAAGFALVFGVAMWMMVRTGGPEFLIVIALWLGGLTTVMVMPRQILEIDSMGIGFPLGKHKIRKVWADVAELAVIEAAAGGLVVGLRPNPASDGARGMLPTVRGAQAAIGRYLSPGSDHAGTFSPERPLTLTNLQPIKARATVDGRPMDRDGFIGQLREVVPRLVVAPLRADSPGYSVRAGYLSSSVFIAMFVLWNGAGLTFMLHSGAFSWPFLVAFVIAAPLILLDWARPPVAVEVNSAGLWISREFLPWNDVQAIAIRPAPGGSDVLVRLRPDSSLLTGPLAAYLQPDPDHGWQVRRRVRHTRIDINALTAATLPYVSIDVLPA